MAKKSRRVSYMKTKNAEVQIHFHGKRMELTIVIPASIERQLTKRLNSPKRFPPK